MLNLPLLSQSRRFSKQKEMVANHIESFFRRMKRRLGCDVSSHRFRHSAATWLVQQGGDMKTAKEILGHTNLKTTAEYVATDIEQMREVMERAMPDLPTLGLSRADDDLAA